jgi:hypothetical protein
MSTSSPRASRALPLVALVAATGLGCFPDPNELQTRSAAPGIDASAGVDMQVVAVDMAQPGADMAQPASGPNNSATLSNGDVGTKASPVMALRKRLNVNVIGGMPPGFTLGQAWGMRLAPNSRALDYVLPITNNTAELWCGVHTAQVVLKNAMDGVVFAVKADETNPVTGIVGVVGTLWTSSCLAPGQTGYFLDIQGPEQADPADYYTPTVSLDLKIDKIAPGVRAPAQVIPTGYTYRPGSFVVQVKNDGPSLARIKMYSNFILFDDAGPVAWELLVPLMLNQVVAVGGVADLNNVRAITTASGSRVYAAISFEDGSLPMTTSLPSGPDTFPGLEAAARARTERYMQLRQLAR